MFYLSCSNFTDSDRPPRASGQLVLRAITLTKGSDNEWKLGVVECVGESKEHQQVVELNEEEMFMTD